MGRKKQLFCIVLSLAMVASLLVAVPAMAASKTSDKKIVMRIGGLFAQDHIIGIGLDLFKEQVETKSGGRIEVQVFHNATLGSEREMAESVKMGSLEGVGSGCSGMGLFFPIADLVELPYLYKDRDTCLKVWDDLTGELNKKIIPGGIRLLGAFDQGTRHIISKKPIYSINDFKGFKLRVPESPLYVGMAKAMGADPVAVAFPEVYTALQTGIADAMEGPPSTVWSQKFYEPTKYYILTGHIICGQFLNINEKFFQSLPDDLKKVVLEGGRESIRLQRERSGAIDQDIYAKLRAKGIEIIEVKDKTPYQNAVKSFQDEYAAKLGQDGIDFLARIRELLNKY